MKRMTAWLLAAALLLAPLALTACREDPPTPGGNLKLELKPLVASYVFIKRDTSVIGQDTGNAELIAPLVAAYNEMEAYLAEDGVVMDQETTWHITFVRGEDTVYLDVDATGTIRAGKEKELYVLEDKTTLFGCVEALSANLARQAEGAS